MNNRKEWWKFKREHDIISPDKKWWQFQLTKKDKYWFMAIILSFFAVYLDELSDNKIIESVIGIFGITAIILIFVWLLKSQKK